MKLLNLIKNLTFALIIFASFGAVANAQVRPYRVSDRQVNTLLQRIETRTDSFRRQMDNALDRSTLNNTSTEDMVNSYLTEFETATDNLRRNFDSRASVNSDVSSVLQRAAAIDNFMRQNRLTSAAQSQWRNLRTDLNSLARYYNVSWNWNYIPNNPNYPNNSGIAYTVNKNTVEALLNRLEQNSDRYRSAMNSALDRSVLNNTRSEDSFNSYITTFESATDTLKRNFQNGNSTDADVQNVLNQGYYIDGFMRDYRFANQAETQWNVVRQDLATLANYYAVSLNWNAPVSPIGQYDSRLDGTYRLNTSLSDDVNAIVNSAANTYFSGNQRDRLRTNLQRRLASPEFLAIDKNNASVTIASNLSPQVTFQADGIARTETLGRNQVKVTGNTNYESVSLNYEGDRINDFYVSFTPIGNDRLRVIRRIKLENRNETIAVASVYDKVAQIADYNMVSNQNTGTNVNTSGNVNSNFYIANGTRLQGSINENLSTKTVQNGDRFSLTISSPSQYSGAIVYGYVSNTERSGRVSGRANMTFNFEQIRLRNGDTYQFRGIVEEVTDAKGNKVSVNNEGVVRDGNQTTKTVVRSGIGAAIGAIIGAVVSGGDGAAIGAAIGGGAGAGSVIAQGRDDLVLDAGSQMIIVASSPSSVANR